MPRWNDLKTEAKVIAWLFIHQPHKMVKHTQKLRRQEPTNCLSVFERFVGLSLRVLMYTITMNGLVQKKLNQVVSCPKILNTNAFAINKELVLCKSIFYVTKVIVRLQWNGYFDFRINSSQSQCLKLVFFVNFYCTFPVGNYMFKVNNRNTRIMCDVQS